MRWLCLGLLLCACGRKEYESTLDRVLDRGVLVIGTEPEFPPFESKNEKGEFVGFDMDLARALARELGVRLQIEEMAFDSLPNALDTGKIDLIVSGMTATPERAKSRTFTEPYYHTRLCLLVGADSGIATPADVDGKTVVVKIGTTGAINAPKLFPNSKITTFDTEGACALEVVHGRAAAFIYDEHSVRRHHEENPRKTRAILEPLSQEPYAMAVRLGDTKFAGSINDFLREFRADGRYEALYRKYWGIAPRDD